MEPEEEWPSPRKSMTFPPLGKTIDSIFTDMKNNSWIILEKSIVHLIWKRKPRGWLYWAYVPYIHPASLNVHPSFCSFSTLSDAPS